MPKLAFAFALLCLLNPAFALDVGTATADITPDVKTLQVPLAGYGARKGKPATGVHDPIHAKILLLRDGAQSLALVTCDLRSVTPQLKQKILKRCGDLKLSPESLLLCASHTHDGPAIFPEKFWELQFGKADPALVDHMSARIATALHAAAKNLAPAKIGFGSTSLTGFTRNRRWNYDKDARAAANESPALHPILSILKIDQPNGRCRALLIHFATHPTILGASNMLVSAEWPGILQKRIEQDFPGATALYCNGAEGDQSPDEPGDADEFARMHRFGNRLADQVQSLAKNIETKSITKIGSIRVLADLPEISFSEGAKKGAYQAFEPLAREALPKKAEIQILRIGDLALAGLPGEPICEVGLDTERHLKSAGFKNVLVIGLANDYIGYIVNPKEYQHGGYEVDQRSYYGPNLGPFLAEQSGLAAKELLHPH